MSKAKTPAADVVRKAQNKNKELGGGRLTLNLTPDEWEMWESWLSSFGNQRGAQKKAFRAMLESALAQGEISKDQVIDWINKRG